MRFKGLETIWNKKIDAEKWFYDAPGSEPIWFFWASLNLNAHLVTSLRPAADFSPPVRYMKALSGELVPRLTVEEGETQTSKLHDSIIPAFDSCANQMINAD